MELPSLIEFPRFGSVVDEKGGTAFGSDAATNVISVLVSLDTGLKDEENALKEEELNTADAEVPLEQIATPIQVLTVSTVSRDRAALLLKELNALMHLKTN